MYRGQPCKVKHANKYAEYNPEDEDAEENHAVNKRARVTTPWTSMVEDSHAEDNIQRTQMQWTVMQSKNCTR